MYNSHLLSRFLFLSFSVAFSITSCSHSLIAQQIDDLFIYNISADNMTTSAYSSTILSVSENSTSPIHCKMHSLALLFGFHKNLYNLTVFVVSYPCIYYLFRSFLWHSIRSSLNHSVIL